MLFSHAFEILRKSEKDPSEDIYLLFCIHLDQNGGNTRKEKKFMLN